MTIHGNFAYLARPYALAAFEHAAAQNDVPAWGIMLETATQIIQDPSVVKALKSPYVSRKAAKFFMYDILALTLNTERSNFIRLLAMNNRLLALPAIATQFEAYRFAHDEILYAYVTSAIPLTDAYRQQLTAVLASRFKRKVMLHEDVNPDILGGACIRIGDTVVDGTVRSKLTRLLKVIKN